jgi:hypothetical protein
LERVQSKFEVRFSRRPFLQKLFPAFPAGWPGFGLLLLRALVAFMLLTQATTASSGWLINAAAVASATILLLGLVTPIVAVAIGLISLVLGFSNDDVVQMVVLTCAIALLGPGALSIDARLFGRREVLIPRRATEVSGAPDRPGH